MKYNYKKILRYRSEILFIYALITFLILATDITILSIKYKLNFITLIYQLFFLLIFSFFIGYLLEFIYFFVKFFSLVFLRFKDLWKYLVPSILIFNLIIFPVYDLTSLKEIFFNLKGLQGSIYIVITGFLLVFSFVLILVLPFFYGVNGGFIILSSILIYLFYKLFILNFPEYHFNLLWFYLYYYFFTAYLYLFFQARRRFGINVIFDTFYYNKYFSLIILLNFILVFIFRYLFIDNLVYYFLSFMALTLLLNTFIIILIINFETLKNKRIKTISLLVNLFLILLINILFFVNFHNFKSHFIITRNQEKFLSMYFMNYLADLFDKDRDGESYFLGKDPDDHNPLIRSEGSLLVKLSQNLKIDINIKKDIFLFTVYFPEIQKDYFITDKHFYLSPSQNINETLYSLFFYISPYELHYSKKFDSSYLSEKKSVFTYLTENYFRTICIGSDNKKGYFSLNSNFRLDKGCEIWIPVTVQNFDFYLNQFIENFYKYKSSKNFIWAHYEYPEKIVNVESLIDKIIHLFSIYNLSLHYEILILLFFDHPVSYYAAFTQNESAREVLLDQFSSYGILYRFLFYEDLLLQRKDIAPFIKDEIDYTYNLSINSYVFYEPEDNSRKLILNYKNQVSLPPISIFLDQNNKEIIFYDGRWGIKYKKNYNSSTDFNIE